METRFQLPRTTPVHGRMGFIAQQASGRRVLHIGCVDSGLTEDRLQVGDLLHAQLEQVASSVTGIDIDAAGIELLQGAGFEDLLVADVTTPGWSAPLQQRPFDLVVVSEVIEHLSDTSVLFEELRLLSVSADASLVITVPSPFSLPVLLALLNNEELVHPDHVCWFSYRTISNLVQRAGFRIVDAHPYTFESTRLRPSFSGRKRETEVPYGLPAVQRSSGGQLLRLARAGLRRVAVRALFARSPWWSDGVIVVAHWPDDRTPRSLIAP